MKKINLFLLGNLFCLVALSSCDNKKKQDPVIDYYTNFYFKMVNNSGVQVAVVAESRDFPDSLVIANGESYSWQMYSNYPSWPVDGRYFAKVYFDKNILIVCNYDNQNIKNPGAPSDYEIIKADDHNYYHTLIFTPEDYQNALKQNEK